MSLNSQNLARASNNNNNNKNEIVAQPTGHGEANFGPTQQPTNNPVELV